MAKLLTETIHDYLNSKAKITRTSATHTEYENSDHKFYVNNKTQDWVHTYKPNKKSTRGTGLTTLKDHLEKQHG